MTSRQSNVSFLQSLLYLGLPLLLILAASVGLHLNVSPHYINDDGVILARDANAIAIQLDNALEGGSNLPGTLSALRASNGILNLVLLLPFSLLFLWLGVSQSSILIIPLLASSLSIILIFAFALHFYDEKVALIAAALWAFLPLEIQYASTYLLTSSLFFWFLAALFLILRAKNAKGKKALILGLLLALAMLPLYPVLALSLLLIALFRSDLFQRALLKVPLQPNALFALLIVLANLLSSQISEYSILLLNQLIQTPAFILLLFLAASAFFLLQQEDKRERSMLSTLLGFAYLTFLLAQHYPSQLSIIVENSKGLALLLIALPLILSYAIFLATKLSSKSIPLLASLSALLVLIPSIVLDLKFSFSEDLFRGDPLLTLSRFMGGLLFPLLFFLPLLARGPRQASKEFAIALILPLFAAAMLFPIAASKISGKDLNTNLLQASQLASAESDNQIIYVCSNRIRNRLWFFSGFANFAQGEIQPSNPFAILKNDSDPGILIADYECKSHEAFSPENWESIAVFGEQKEKMIVYKNH